MWLVSSVRELGSLSGVESGTLFFTSDPIIPMCMEGHASCHRHSNQYQSKKMAFKHEYLHHLVT